MKILEPVEMDSIPASLSGPNVHRALYDRVLALNGLAVPVEFENLGKARNFRVLFCHPRGLARRLGLQAAQRGTTVFVYRPKDDQGTP